MDKEINNNGYEYVDLGLPSGTLWATCNVGAKKPSESGLYFQWGGIKGYTADQVGTGSWQKKFALDWGDDWGDTQEYSIDQVGKGEEQKKFASDWNDHKRNPNSDWETFTKYIKEGAKLELEDDAVHVNMGGSWHMPSPTQIQELIDNTASNFETVDGIRGMKFISKNGKSIFIPAAGLIYEKSVLNSGYTGSIWSSMLSESYVGNGQYLYIYPGYASLDDYHRSFGFSVRGVIG